MSRIGNKHLPLPSGVSYKLENGVATITGPKGELSVNVPTGISVEENENVLVVKRANDSVALKQKHGTTRALLHNAVVGVSEGFSKNLVIVGIGYRAAIGPDQKSIVLNLGYSHPVTLPFIEGVTVTCPSATEIIVSGISKEKVGQMAALIRACRAPEPYKGKGIAYKNEHIIRKEGKRAGAK